MNSSSILQSTTVVTPRQQTPIPGARWQPQVGSETKALIQGKVIGDEGKKVIDSAISILARGVNPTEHNIKRTGLVIGYVQSGKTLSFTTVIALARENRFRIIIVVAGISKALFNQSSNRLLGDLNVKTSGGYFRWKHFVNPSLSNFNDVKQVLDEWEDQSVPDDQCPSVLITVMKHHTHLKHLNNLLEKLNLDGSTALIIDDEADQASLNTLVKQDKESTTYNRLLELRDSLPCHTYLQYTATPQAPLLINIIDTLSPDFVEILEPGKLYVGGQSFFFDAEGLVKVIPEEDISTNESPLLEPPDSLLDAIRIFLVGVAVDLFWGRNEIRSMLVHPSRKTDQHQQYINWIEKILQSWLVIFKLPNNDSDKIDLLRDFQKAYLDFNNTVQTLPTFDEIEKVLPRAIRHTKTEEVNTRDGRPTPIIEWHNSFSWILVGGQAMDRGFTVEGLTVTYMPRGQGIGNIDTIQQRGRFFGYKKNYLGYCRTYLEQDVRIAFENYVQHEEEMRAQLQKVRDSGEPLKNWKRNFILSTELQPCRKNILSNHYVQGNYSNRWFVPSIIRSSNEIINENRYIVEDFVHELPFLPTEGNPKRKKTYKHIVCRGVKLDYVIKKLLLPYRLQAARDSLEMVGILLQLSHALETFYDELCVVYHMRPNFISSRTINNNGRISELFQGAAPVYPEWLRGSTYEGDRNIHEQKDVTVQIHFINLKKGKAIVEEKVPVIAIWIPKRMELPWVAQIQ